MNPVIQAIEANLRAIELQDENAKLREALWVIGEDCKYVLERRELDGYRVEQFISMTLGRVRMALNPEPAPQTIEPTRAMLDAKRAVDEYKGDK